MSAPRQGELTLGCLVLAAQLFSVLGNSLLLRRDGDSTQLKASPEAVCKNLRRKPFSDRTYNNYAQSRVFKSATAVFYVNVLNMSKKKLKLKSFRLPGVFRNDSDFMEIHEHLKHHKQETAIIHMLFITLLSKPLPLHWPVQQKYWQ